MLILNGRAVINFVLNHRILGTLNVDSAANALANNSEQNFFLGGANHFHHPLKRAQNQFPKAVSLYITYILLFCFRTGGFTPESHLEKRPQFPFTE